MRYIVTLLMKVIDMHIWQKRIIGQKPHKTRFEGKLKGERW